MYTYSNQDVAFMQALLELEGLQTVFSGHDRKHLLDTILIPFRSNLSHLQPVAQRFDQAVATLWPIPPNTLKEVLPRGIDN